MDGGQATTTRRRIASGIGISWSAPKANPQIAVRAYEVEQVSATGQRL
jgi:hypothetical protein